MSQAKQKTAKKTISTPKAKLDLLVEDQEAIEGIEGEETLPSPTPKKNTRAIILIVALLLLVTLAAFAFSQNSTTQESLEESGAKEGTQSFSELFRQPELAPEEPALPSPSPSPIWILPGKETYTISQGNKEGPRIKTISIDPQDPTTNDSSQTITAVLSYSQPIDGVSLKLVSDNEEKLADMVLTEGTDKNGTWKTKWEITDSVLYTYTLSLTVSSQDQQSVIDLTIR